MIHTAQVARSLLASALLLSPLFSNSQTVEGAKPFAIVGEARISREAYEAAVAAGVRQKFYHSRPPERELAEYRREVGERLIERELLLPEAKRRGFAPDRARIDQVIAGYDKRYGSSERWRTQRDKMLPPLVAELERQSLLEQLEASVRAVPAPSESEARAYYERHKDRFTEPEQVRLSLILLRVEPSAPAAARQQAEQEAARLKERLRRGADFGELARMHSADPSAKNGGDLGYVHRGMLPEALQSGLIDALKPGQVSEPARVLEGVALVRLEDRKLPRLRAFDDVRARAAELAQRGQGDEAWKSLIAALRARVSIRVDESVYQTSLAQ